MIYKERYGFHSKKWDDMQKNFGRKDLIPLWLADMDYTIAPEITEALQLYIEYGIPGYFKVPDTYWESFINWEKGHGYLVEKEWLRYSPSVMTAIHWLINALTEKNEAIITFAPAYKQFLSAVNQNKRPLVVVPLDQEEGYYFINYELLEKELVKNHVRLMIFCSPHNPTGRVWKKEEIQKLMDLCKKYKLYVISDEIYQDIVFENVHIPTATVGEYEDILVTVTSATKSFNIAGCRNSLVIIPSKEIRKRFDRFRKQINVKKGNAFGYIATQAAFLSNGEWLEEVKQKIYDNYQYLRAVLLREIPLLRISPLQGTFLCWIDFTQCDKIIDLRDFMIEKCQIAVEFGDEFGGSNYQKCVRVNLATGKNNIVQLADRVLKQWKEL